MRILIRLSVASIALILLLSNPLSRVSAEGPNDKSQASADQSSRANLKREAKTDESVPEMGLLEASRRGLITAHAIVARLGQPLRVNAGQGFRGASRHVAGR
jgi:hypothetical protein